MDMIPNIIGYHTNDKDRCEKFINNFECIFSEDTYWLGYGMYFWDTKSNAVYWKNEKFRKHKNINIIWIVKANIILDSILDLTDTENAEDFENLWNEYIQKENISDAQIPIGKKIDILFDFFELEYKAVKCFGDYYNNIYIKNQDIFKTTKITQKIKTIYCVKNSENIKYPTFSEEFKR